MPTTTSELSLNTYSEHERRTKNRNYNDTAEAVDDLASGDQYRKKVVETDSPANGAETAVAADTEVHVVNPDGTNAVNLDDAAEQGREVTVVHNGGDSTPTLSFSDSDFGGYTPQDLIVVGESVRLYNTDGTTSGWVVIEEPPRGRTDTISPANGAAASVPTGAVEVLLINPDGTNAVDLDAAADAGREITIVHNGGADTPTLSFTDADFVGTGPANMTNAGQTATLLNTDGTASGWVVKATGSA